MSARHLSDWEPAVKKWARTPAVQKWMIQPRRMAPVVGQFMVPAALTSYVLALWRLGADLNWAAEFFVSQGLFSRWQVWLAIGIAAQLAAKELGRTGRSDNTATP